ncbi:ATP-dependent DNA helicase PIF1-like [Littorina saxatilis]|uniref:ATP-dependent DNA helicase PIF1-like n=1 Tax=Littorina saxatilis TaxID=31220 RepID=UPI0038B61AF8
MQNSTIICTLSLQEVSPTGNVIKQTLHKNVTLILGRDEFGEIQLQIEHPKKVTKLKVREIFVHKKFMTSGKATVKLPDQRLQLMLSNCPPDQLAVFIRTLQTKLEVLRQKGFVHQRTRLLSEAPRGFTEISPLTLKDLQAVNKAPGKNAGTTASAAGTRKRASGDSQENQARSGTSTATDGGIKRQKSFQGISPSKIVARPVTLNKEQNAVLQAVMSGKSVFFTGSAGTGKSFLLKRIIGALPPQHTFATASTGVAACHIGGTTLHSFAGIGSGKSELPQCVELASRPQVAQQWRRCRHLIIDEISMVDGDFFKKLEAVAGVIRKSDQPFGGIQLIVCGDFLQLPPVSRDRTARFCFQTSAWHRCIQMTMELKEVRRQSDTHFIRVLQAIRLGSCPQMVIDTLVNTVDNNIEREGVLATKLCTHKEDVSVINSSKLSALEGEMKTFIGTDSDSVYADNLDKLCPASGKLNLKLGAQVLLCKNLDVGRGLVNGARGIITGFDSTNEGFPVVRFVCGVIEVIKPVRWVFKISGGAMLARKQVPLKLAWAISIHKSQGMTLDCVEISLTKVFECGQSYVALSRAKSLEGLRVLGFSPNCIRANSDVLRFYQKLDLIQRMGAMPQPVEQRPGSSSGGVKPMKVW